MHIKNKRDVLTAKAQRGDVDAQYSLGELWEKGNAIHLVYAYFWYALAAKHGHPKAAAARDKVGKFLSAMVRGDEDKLLAKWKPTAPPTPAPHFRGDEKTDELAWLQAWYKFQARDTWEEDFGVKIETMGNPGWSVKIDVAETSLEYKPFTEIKEDRGKDDWMTCRVMDAKFESFGDPSKLKRMLEVFKSWASEPYEEDNQGRLEVVKSLAEFSDGLDAISMKLKSFPWDYDGPGFMLSQSHVVNVLNRYLKDEIDAQKVEKWADLIECRDDIDFETAAAKQLIHDLANPYLSQSLDKKWAQELIEMAPSASEKK